MSFVYVTVFYELSLCLLNYSEDQTYYINENNHKTHNGETLFIIYLLFNYLDENSTSHHYNVRSRHDQR